MNTGLRRRAIHRIRRRQAEAEARHLEVYPTHVLLPEVSGRTLCLDCDAWLARPYSFWERLPW